MKWIVYLTLFGITMTANAELTQEAAHGFHWYSKKEQEKEQQKIQARPAATPPKAPYDKLMDLRREALNKLAQALIEPSFEATHDYMKTQMVYAKKNQEFVRYWEQVLLVHPELDHTLNFPTDNSAIALRNDSTNGLMERILKEGSKKYGLILFYRGESSVSQRFITILMPFVNDYHFSMISVSTDLTPIEGLPNAKSIPLPVIQKSIALESKYMPALFLVDLKTQKMSPLSYGFVSMMDLKERFLDVATNFKRFSYEGLSV